ncbi:MAG: branched-chain amino acid ABC transporter permease [Alphaproteobacteria bacterium]|nr:branched-chain amino acid ABC transporter permease [Alphaproteobacteria bacterium]
MRRDTAVLLLLAVGIAVLPFALPNRYFYDVAILAGINAIVCVGLNLLIGYTGQISLGHAGFFGLGAYASAILTGYGCPAPAAMAAGAVIVGALAALVGRPILRLKGHYLAMATLGMGIIISIVITTEDRVTGGPDGMAVAPFGLLGWSVQGEEAWYWVIGASLVATVALALNLIASPVGRALRAIHGSETAAEVMGVDVARYKRMVFVLSAVLAALAGSLAAHYSGFVSPAKAGFMHSIELVTMVVFGGMASTLGAVVGAVLLTVLPQLLTVLKDYELLMFGALLMGTMILMPRGLLPTLETLWRRARI